MVDYKSIAKEAKFLAIFYLFLIFVLKIIGFDVIDTNFYDKYEIFKIIDSNLILRNLSHIILGIIGYNLMFASIINYNLNKIIKINLIIVPYLITMNLLVENEMTSIFTIILSMTIYFIPMLFGYSAHKVSIITFIDCIFQVVSLITRGITLPNERVSVTMTILYISDYCLLWLIELLNKKEVENLCHYLELVLSYLATKLKSCKKKGIFILKYLEKQLKTMKENILNRNLLISTARLKCWIKYTLPIKLKLQIVPLLAFVIIYGGFAIISNKVLESILLFISYGTFRFMFPKQFHADYIPNIKKQWINITCTCLSCLVLCTALYNTVFVEISIIASVFVAFIMDYILYMLRVAFDYIAEAPFIKTLKQKYETDFTKYGFTAETANIAYLWKVKGLKDKEILELYPKLTEGALTKRKNRINKGIAQAKV